MFRAYKYRIYPTDSQQELIARTFGCCRYVYNWALSTKITAYKETKETLSRFSLQKKMKDELKESCQWLKEVNSQSLQSSLMNLDIAYKNFFRNTKAVGFPKFKSKFDKQSFQCPQNVKVDFSHSILTIPKIKDIPIELHRKFTGAIKTVTISKTPSGKYFASILVDTNLEPNAPKPIDKEHTIGVDMGIKSLAVCSNGSVFENGKNLRRSLHRLTLLQRRLSKKHKGSANRIKAKNRVAILHEKVANQRKDTLHKITYRLTHENQVNTICIEDLNVKGMVKNHCLSQAINDASFGMFRTMLEYKCSWYGINLKVIDRFAPSSKRCNVCGHIYKKLALSERTWICSECGTHLDRDLNAAINIKQYGINALPVERRKVKAAECPTMDDRSERNLRSSGMRKQQKRGVLCPEAHPFRGE